MLLFLIGLYPMRSSMSFHSLSNIVNSSVTGK